jgi:putative transposase
LQALSLRAEGRAVHPIRWYDLYQTGGLEALEDKPSRPLRVWNRLPDKVRDEIVQLALDEPELSPRELAAHFTDTKSYFVSEASVYRLLKAHDLVPGPAFIVVKAAEVFKDKTSAPNQLWQTDFTYLKVIGWAEPAKDPAMRKHRWMAVLSQHDPR